MKIHFIGIGGIGVSALARYYLAQGFSVSGSDCAENEVVGDLRRLGAEIFIGHQSGNIKKSDFLIFSAAIPEDNPELKEARRQGIRCLSYAEALGELTKKMYTVAVSGMHGKSTTTAMIGLIMEKAGLDPTVIVGTKVREWGGSNFRLGRSQYLVIEADEYNASFLNYWPKIIVLLNIEEEHLDYYRDLEHILKTFREYVGYLSEKDGVLIANEEDENVEKISQKLKIKSQKYNLKVKITGLKLKIPGQHNLSNAAAAITAARTLGIADKIAVKTLNNFNGTWRRMEYKGLVNGARIYDDYGHHPTEIKATLSGARELLKNPKSEIRNLNTELWCVFQPHQYQRTYKLFNHFIGSFAAADKVVLLPIYSVAGREKEDIKKKVSSKMLVEAIKMQNAKCKMQNDNVELPGNQVALGDAKCKIIKSQDVIYLDSFDKAANYLKKTLKAGDICLVMGAGDIYRLSEMLMAGNG